MERPGLIDALRYLAIALILVEGGIHLQQYVGVLNEVPTINSLFLLNAFSAAGIALVLSVSNGPISIATALGGIGLTLGALVSLAITRVDTLFDYSEPMLRTAVTLATVVELAAVVVLAAYIVVSLRPASPRGA